MRLVGETIRRVGFSTFSSPDEPVDRLGPWVLTAGLAFVREH
jgi:hypothetical protein